MSKDMKKIYFVGAQCTGKTTIGEYVSSRYNIPIVSEVVRDVAEGIGADLGEIRRDMGLVADFQRKICMRQLQEEKSVESDYLVSDRGIDFLAYASEYSMNISTLKDMKQFKDYVKWMDKNSVIFFLRPRKKLIDGIDDGFRENLSWSSILRIDGMIKFILEFYNFDYINIDTDIFQNRVRTVNTVLKVWW